MEAALEDGYIFSDSMSNMTLLPNDTSRPNAEGAPGGHSSQAMIVSTFFFTLIILVGIVGNASVVWLICSYRTMRQAVMNLYILNMAIADLMLNILGVPETVQFVMNRGWLLGFGACKVLRFLMVCSLYVSILSLLAVTIERFVAILYPMQAHALLTKQRVVIAILCIWVISILCALPTAIFNQLHMMPDGLTYCILALAADFPTHTKRKLVYKYFEFTIFFAIPLVVQVFLYSIITYKLHESTTQLKINKDDFKPINSNNNNSNHNSTYHSTSPSHQVFKSTDKRNNNTVKSRKHVIKMLIACVLVYFISYMPAQAFLFYETAKGHPFNETWLTRVILLMLGFINAAANPIIYCMCSETYRSRFKVMYRCQDKRARRLKGLKSSLRSGESIRTVQTSSFRLSNQESATTEGRELHHLQPLVESKEESEPEESTTLNTNSS